MIQDLSQDPSSVQTGQRMKEQMVPLINRTFVIIMISLLGISITFIISAALFPYRREIAAKGVSSQQSANCPFAMTH